MTTPSSYSISISRLLKDDYGYFIERLPDEIIRGELPQHAQDRIMRTAWLALQAGIDLDKVLDEIGNTVKLAAGLAQAIAANVPSKEATHAELA